MGTETETLHVGKVNFNQQIIVNHLYNSRHPTHKLLPLKFNSKNENASLCFMVLPYTEVIKARGDDVAPRCRSGLVKFELVPQGVWVFFIFRHFDHIKYRQRQGEWNNNTRDWLEFC